LDSTKNLKRKQRKIDKHFTVIYNIHNTQNDT